MKKYILHDQYNAISRSFVDMYGEKFDDIIDWYSGNEAERWVRLGGTLRVQGFPSIARIIAEDVVDMIFMPTDEQVEQFLSMDDQIEEYENDMSN